MDRDDQLALIRQHSSPMEPLATNETPRMRRLPNVEAVLFDVYGTLLISSSGDIGATSQVQARAMDQVLEECGLGHLAKGEDAHEIMMSVVREHHERQHQAGVEHPEVDMMEVWRELLPRLGYSGPSPDGGATASGESPPIDLEWMSLRYELCANPVWPMPNAVTCLTELAGRGAQLGLISNGQWFSSMMFPALVGGDLSAFGIAPDMEFWSYRVGQAKPGEHLFQLAAEALGAKGIPPERVLHVGNDLLKDVLPASRTGFKTALFAGDARSLRRREGDPRVASVEPDIVIVDLRQVLTCVRPDEVWDE